MVNPLAPAYNMFLNIWNVLPLPVQYLVYLAIGLFSISIVVNLIMR